MLISRQEVAERDTQMAEQIQFFRYDETGRNQDPEGIFHLRCFMTDGGCGLPFFFFPFILLMKIKTQI